MDAKPVIAPTKKHAGLESASARTRHGSEPTSAASLTTSKCDFGGTPHPNSNSSTASPQHEIT
jgi:hypothetical protein